MEKSLRQNSLISNFFNDVSLGTAYKDTYLLYTRRSTDDANNQRNSIDYQLSEGLQYIEKHGFKLAPLTIDIFCQNGIIKEYHSAFKEKKEFEILPDGSIKQKVDRPKFLMMAYLLQKKYFKGVICLCWDRISRNKSDEVIIDKLVSLGIDIQFVHARYDKTRAGMLHMEIDGIFSREYSRAISEKVKDAAKELRGQGKCIYKSPIGYIDEGSTLKSFDPIRAPIVKRIFELYATGEWSYAKLAQWANQQGLTTKPVRRKRSPYEKLMGVELETLPKVSRLITPKAIENILANPFYIGKNQHKNEWIESTVHQPLIDNKLFFKVRELRKKRTVSIHYPDSAFATYRGLITCGICGRGFSPYVHKGKTYYRLKCKRNCDNTVRNVSEAIITKQIQAIFATIYFSDNELERIEEDAKYQLNIVTERRNKELEDLYRRLNKAMADIDYMAKERLTLLRTQTMSLEDICSEENRLKSEISDVQVKINANVESSRAMLNYVITFSNLLKGAEEYFEHAMDDEKKQLVVHTFSNLYFIDGKLKYVANEGYLQLFKVKECSIVQLGAPNYLFSNLKQISDKVKPALAALKSFLDAGKKYA